MPKCHKARFSFPSSNCISPKTAISIDHGDSVHNDDFHQAYALLVRPMLLSTTRACMAVSSRKYWKAWLQGGGLWDVVCCIIKQSSHLRGLPPSSIRGPGGSCGAPTTYDWIWHELEAWPAIARWFQRAASPYLKCHIATTLLHLSLSGLGGSQPAWK